MNHRDKAPLDYLQNGLQGVLGGMTILIYGAFALLVVTVVFGFIYALMVG